jgi:hypothetical protein
MAKLTLEDKIRRAQSVDDLYPLMREAARSQAFKAKVKEFWVVRKTREDGTVQEFLGGDVTRRWVYRWASNNKGRRYFRRGDALARMNAMYEHSERRAKAEDVRVVSVMRVEFEGDVTRPEE